MKWVWTIYINNMKSIYNYITILYDNNYNIYEVGLMHILGKFHHDLTVLPKPGIMGLFMGNHPQPWSNYSG